MVQKGKFSAGIASFVSVLKSVDLPTFGNPTWNEKTRKTSLQSSSQKPASSQSKRFRNPSNLGKKIPRPSTITTLLLHFKQSHLGCSFLHGHWIEKPSSNSNFWSFYISTNWELKSNYTELRLHSIPITLFYHSKNPIQIIETSENYHFPSHNQSNYTHQSTWSSPTSKKHAKLITNFKSSFRC